jgi:hypothetical protein
MLPPRNANHIAIGGSNNESSSNYANQVIHKSVRSISSSLGQRTHGKDDETLGEDLVGLSRYYCYNRSYSTVFNSHLTTCWTADNCPILSSDAKCGLDGTILITNFFRKEAGHSLIV